MVQCMSPASWDMFLSCCFSFFVGGAQFWKIAGRNSTGFQNILARRFRYHRFTITDCSSKESSLKWALQSRLVSGLKTSEWVFFMAFVHSLAQWVSSGHLYMLTPSLRVLEHHTLRIWAHSSTAVNPITLYCLKWILDIKKRTYTRDHWYKESLKFLH